MVKVVRMPRVFVLLLALFAACDSKPVQQNTDLPNIFLFLADDMTWRDCSVYGNPDVYTPNLQRMSEAGMTFHSMYTATAMCAPTRQQLYTGLYPVRNGAYPNHSQVQEGTNSLVHHFQQLGYRVALVGKRHYGPAESFPFEYLGGRDSDNGKGGADIDLNLIDPVLTSDQPFLLIVAQNQPHLPWNRGNPSRYLPDSLEMPEYMVDTPFTRKELTKYYAEITYMDSLLGVCLDKIEAVGKAENTLSIFTSEQGAAHPFAKWTCYERGLKTGFIAQWPGVIAPKSQNELICQYVDVLPTLLEAVGEAPELVDTGNADAGGSRGFDGMSFLKVLLGQSGRHGEVAFGVHTTRGINNGSPAYPVRSVRDHRYRYIRNLSFMIPFQNNETELPDRHYQNWLKSTSDTLTLYWLQGYQYRPYEELYDLNKDPWERHNLADDPAYEAVMQNLGDQLEKWMLQQGDLGVMTEMKAFERMAKH